MLLLLQTWLGVTVGLASALGAVMIGQVSFRWLRARRQVLNRVGTRPLVDVP